MVVRLLFKQTYIRSEALFGTIWSVRTEWLIESRDVARKATASLSLQRGKKCEPETVRWSVVTPKERSDAVRALPACTEHNRLCKLQDPFYARMEALIQQMFTIPARTAEGCHAKATVHIGRRLARHRQGNGISRIDGPQPPA